MLSSQRSGLGRTGALKARGSVLTAQRLAVRPARLVLARVASADREQQVSACVVTDSRLLRGLRAAHGTRGAFLRCSAAAAADQRLDSAM